MSSPSTSKGWLSRPHCLLDELCSSFSFNMSRALSEITVTLAQVSSLSGISNPLTATVALHEVPNTFLNRGMMCHIQKLCHILKLYPGSDLCLFPLLQQCPLRSTVGRMSSFLEFAANGILGWARLSGMWALSALGALVGWLAVTHLGRGCLLHL